MANGAHTFMALVQPEVLPYAAINYQLQYRRANNGSFDMSQGQKDGQVGTYCCILHMFCFMLNMTTMTTLNHTKNTVSVLFHPRVVQDWLMPFAILSALR